MRITALSVAVILWFLIFCVATSNMIAIAQTEEPLVSENLFDVNILYAYVQPDVSSVVTVLNFTRISNPTFPSNSGITEVYTVEVFSEGKLVRTTGMIGGISGKGIDASTLLDLAMSGSFEAYENIGVVPFSASFSPILYPDLAKPVSLSVVRKGWITVDADTADLNLSSNETVKHVELAQYQEGFLYNTLLTQEELTKIDLFNPLESSHITSPTPSASPSPNEPSTLVLIAIGIGTGASIAVVIIFFRMRK